MIINRQYYLDKLIARKGNKRVKVITGIRRCGKSVLLFDLYLDLYRDYLRKEGIKDEQVISLKLDKISHARYRNPFELDKYVREQIKDSDKQYYVFLDEIQEVSSMPNPWLDDKEQTIGFVEVLLGLMDIDNVDVYVTGSNSKMLSSDIITEFRDRGDEIHVNPLMYS